MKILVLTMSNKVSLRFRDLGFSQDLSDIGLVVFFFEPSCLFSFASRLPLWLRDGQTTADPQPLGFRVSAAKKDWKLLHTESFVSADFACASSGSQRISVLRIRMLPACQIDLKSLFVLRCSSLWGTKNANTVRGKQTNCDAKLQT